MDGGQSGGDARRNPPASLIKRIRKQPLLWLLLAALLYFSISTIFDEHRDYSEVPTSHAMRQVAAGNVREASLEDKEQKLLLTLKNEIEVEDQQASKVITQYPARVSNVIYDQLEDKGVKYDVQVTQDSVLGQLLTYIICSPPFSVQMTAPFGMRICGV